MLVFHDGTAPGTVHDASVKQQKCMDMSPMKAEKLPYGVTFPFKKHNFLYKYVMVSHAKRSKSKSRVTLVSLPVIKTHDK